MSRRPTDEEYNAYDGMHCRVTWRSLPRDWRCPVCDRTKREVLIWGERKGSNARDYGKIGFKAGIHKHHDHGSDFGAGRFPDTHVCGACNRLDATLKKKVEAVENFSFSPAELRQCLKSVRPNEGIKSTDINFERALEIYTIRKLLPKD